MNYLKTPDASLSSDVSGSGPVPLMIPGGAADAGGFARIAPLLADTHTVVTVDPRGISRSRLAEPIEDLSIEMLADDMHRLLVATSREPARVFASSGGGQVGLALVARYPEQVQTLVVHEPPAIALLADDDSRRGGPQEIYDTYRRQGIGAAIQGFLAFTGFGAGEEEGRCRSRPTCQTCPGSRRRARVVVGVGEASGGDLANDTALVLADRLGTPAVIFPGGHSGYFTHPSAFAQKLRQVLADA